MLVDWDSTSNVSVGGRAEVGWGWYGGGGVVRVERYSVLMANVLVGGLGIMVDGTFEVDDERPGMACC